MEHKSGDKTRGRNAGADHPYDSILQRILSDMSGLLIPLVNVLFGTKFTMNAKITMHPREIMLRKQDGGVTERVVDALFSIEEGAQNNIVHIEFETSPSPVIRLRLVDYRFGIASRILGKTGNSEAWTLPESGIVCLRSTLPGKPDYIYETYELPGVVRYEDDEVRYEKARGPVRITIGNPVLYMQDYKADRLIECDLALLMPFLLFAYMSDAETMRDESVRQYILQEFQKVADYYVRESEKPDGIITIDQASILVDVTTMATEYLGSGLPELIEGVKRIMYAEPIETRTTRLLNEVTYLRDEATYLRNEATYLRDETNHLRDETNHLRNEATYLRDETNHLRDETNHLRDENERQATELTNKGETIVRLETELESNSKEIEGNKKEIEELKATIRQLRGED